MKECEHFEYPTKVTVTFDDMIGMKCPLCQIRDNVEDGFMEIDKCPRITKDDMREFLEGIFE